MAIDEKEFNSNLNKVISWTNELSKDFDYETGFYGSVFRHTNPTIDGHYLYEIDSDYATWNIDDSELSNYQEALNQILSLRKESQPIQVDNLSKLGRILRMELGFTTHDGVIIVDTQCFFDESDVPPIDTWFYLESKPDINNSIGILYCWIPKPFEHFVNHAMELDFFDCYTWFDKFPARSGVHG